MATQSVPAATPAMQAPVAATATAASQAAVQTPLGIAAAPTQMASLSPREAAVQALLAPRKKPLILRIIYGSVHYIAMPFKWLFNCCRGKTAPPPPPVRTATILLTRQTCRNQCQETITKLHVIRLNLRNLMVALPIEFPHLPHRITRAPFVPLPMSLHLSNASAMYQMSNATSPSLQSGEPDLPAERYLSELCNEIIIAELMNTHHYLMQLQEMLSDTPRAPSTQHYHHFVANARLDYLRLTAESAHLLHLNVLGNLHILRLSIPSFYSTLLHAYGRPPLGPQELQLPPSYPVLSETRTSLTEERAQAMHQEEMAQLTSIEQMINTLSLNLRQQLQQIQIPQQPQPAATT